MTDVGTIVARHEPHQNEENPCLKYVPDSSDEAYATGICVGIVTNMHQLDGHDKWNATVKWVQKCQGHRNRDSSDNLHNADNLWEVGNLL